MYLPIWFIVLSSSERHFVIQHLTWEVINALNCVFCVSNQ